MLDAAAGGSVRTVAVETCSTMDFPTSPIASLLAEARPPAVGIGSRTGLGLGHYAAACCRPAELPPPAGRRLRLHDLDPHIHCSVIGTCLSAHELRRLVPRYTNIDAKNASDLDIHHAAVELAAGGEGAKALHKSLDARYAAVIRRFHSAKDVDALLLCWEESLAQGDVPGAYWALLTHARATPDLRQRAFGEVHMLSHLVGAANRADIRRLIALEADNARLKETVERQQQRLRDVALDQQAAQRRAQNAEGASSAMPRDDAMLAALRQQAEALATQVAARDQEVAHQTRRREEAERQVAELQQLCTELRESAQRCEASVQDFGHELRALEAALARRLDADGRDDRVSRFLAGKRIVQVGGRPSSNRALSALVESAGGQLSVHDGGIEDRKGLLATVLRHADFVVFPVDCIDHGSMLQVKRLCERHGIAFHPLRSASVASFLALIDRLSRPVLQSVPARSPICLRHG